MSAVIYGANEASAVQVGSTVICVLRSGCCDVRQRGTPAVTVFNGCAQAPELGPRLLCIHHGHGQSNVPNNMPRQLQPCLANPAALKPSQL